MVVVFWCVTLMRWSCLTGSSGKGIDNQGRGVESTSLAVIGNHNMPEPVPTVLEFVQCIQTSDLGVSEGKRALNRILTPLGPYWKQQQRTLREKYRAEGSTVADANRLAALDIAAQLPDADDLPAGLLVSLRPAEGSQPKVGMTGGPRGYRAVPELMAAGRQQAKAKETQFDCLMAAVQDDCKSGRIALSQSVSWVSANLRTPLERIKAEGVPGPEALALWQWARQNETEYRRLYDSRRISTKGIVEDEEKGFIDDGKPIEDIILRIRTRGASDVSMRHLQAAESGGNDGGQEGGVHDLPECSTEERPGVDPGRGG